MKSRLAEESELRQIEAVRALTREERLRVYDRHCQQIARLAEAGRKLREARRASAAPRAGAARCAPEESPPR